MPRSMNGTTTFSCEPRLHGHAQEDVVRGPGAVFEGLDAAGGDAEELLGQARPRR